MIKEINEDENIYASDAYTEMKRSNDYDLKSRRSCLRVHKLRLKETNELVDKRKAEIARLEEEIVTLTEYPAKWIKARKDESLVLD